MITERSTDELVALGARYRSAYLVEQAGYTLGIAAEDGADLDALLDSGYVGEVGQAADAVRAGLGDKAIMEADAKEATRTQNEKLRDAKVWRRKVARRGQRMARMGRTVPATLTRIANAATVPDVLRQLDEMVPALAQSQTVMGGASAQALIDEGNAIKAALAGADQAQETKRLSALPAAVRDFFGQKGRLYVGIKVVNDAGHELHADDAVAAGRYNLKILHRRAGKRAPAAAAAPTG